MVMDPRIDPRISKETHAEIAAISTFLDLLSGFDIGTRERILRYVQSWSDSKMIEEGRQIFSKEVRG